MKKINKNTPPALFSQYIASHPNATWDDVRNDFIDKKSVYKDIKEQIIKEQYYLCAYCECRINLDENSRIEHFHPKSDTATNTNWHILLSNLLGVCNGGEQGEQDAFPLPQNLSCDAAKKNKICDGEIVNPLKLPPFPPAFSFNKSDGTLAPNKEFCEKYTNIEGNKCNSTCELLKNTIKILNLNCDRLCINRIHILHGIEKRKKALRSMHKNNLNCSPDKILKDITEQFFRNKWPAYFTTIRNCLGEHAEKYLKEKNFDG